jgi:hypothetical protein
MLTSMQLHMTPSNDYTMRSISLTDPSKCPSLELPFAVDFNDEKAYVALIRKIENLIRGSYEYREYIKYLKESMDQNRCLFIRAVDYRKKNATIELHHCPFTLWDIVDLHIRKAINETGTVRTFEVVEQVLVNHQENLVGLVPLSETCHELVHEGNLFVPLDSVFGNWPEFVSRYGEYITESQKRILGVMEQLTIKFRETNNPNNIPEILRVIVGHHHS